HHIVTLHGGQVSASSAGAGSGTTIVVSLPQTADVPAVTGSGDSGAAAAVKHRSSRLRGIKAMVVDDELDAREAIAAVLEQSGAEVRLCASVRQALSELEVWTPEVIVTDIGMPELDGFALVRAVRSGRDQLRDLPIVGVTAYAASEDRGRALRSGFTHWLPKPIEPVELTAVIASLVRN
ncbi:MAG TPA: response regulator, partial [Terriglobales bacterium]|nr:response regulator [Terriglobales bacterium]